MGLEVTPEPTPDEREALERRSRGCFEEPLGAAEPLVARGHPGGPL